MTPDPYPDLVGGEPYGAAAPYSDVDEPAPDDRLELSEADSRLLDALSHAGPAVVSAVEDQPRTVRSGRAPAPRDRGPLAPVFREPPG